jgi:hypothetical protein
MNPDRKETLLEIAGTIAGLTVVLRDIGKKDGLDDREREGVEVMAVELGAVVEGLKNLCQLPLASSDKPER